MKYLFLILSFGLIGCGWDQGSGNYAIYVDPNFVPAQQALVHNAFATWEKSMNSFVSFHDTKDWTLENNVILVSPASIQGLSIYSEDVVNSEVVGQTNVSDGTREAIMVAINLEDGLFETVCQHEIGHALGLHHEDEHVVMNPDALKDAHHVVCGDVMQFCEIWECDPFKMDICKGN